MSKITNDGLSRSGIWCFIAVPIRQQWASNGNTKSPDDNTVMRRWWSLDCRVERYGCRPMTGHCLGVAGSRRWMPHDSGRPADHMWNTTMEAATCHWTVDVLRRLMYTTSCRMTTECSRRYVIYAPWAPWMEDCRSPPAAGPARPQTWYCQQHSITVLIRD